MRYAVFSITWGHLPEVWHISMDTAQSLQAALFVAMWFSTHHLSEKQQQPTYSQCLWQSFAAAYCLVSIQHKVCLSQLSHP